MDNRPAACWVVPFGNPRIKGYLLLNAAYRSLSRPSSPVRAKASAIRPLLLSLDFLVMRIHPHGRLIILSAFLYSCLLLYCVQYVKDLYGHRSMASGGTAGLEPVLAAGLDTLVPLCI